jgi:hypothetical protein
VGVFVLFVLLLAYGVPAAILVGVAWLAGRVLRRWLSAKVVIALGAGALALVLAGEFIPAQLAARIAREPAEDLANSVVANSVLFHSAGTAGEALAANPWLEFAEGMATGRDSPVFASLPPGKIRFSGRRDKPKGGACPPGELEVPNMRAFGTAAPQRACLAWRRVPQFEAQYVHFQVEPHSYRVGPFRVSEIRDGLVRRADGRVFNLYKNVEVTGGLWWWLVEMCGRATGVSGFGHAGHVDSTYSHIPREKVIGFTLLGAHAVPTLGQRP